MPPLRIGMVGDDVTSLQLALVSIGLLAGDPTGAFDQITLRAVIEMQRRAGLAQTGVMDDASWNALFQMQATVAPSPDTNTPGTGPKAGTTYLEPTDVSGAPSRGTLLFWGLLAGGAYWFTHKGQAHATDEYDDDDGEEDEDDEDDEDEYEEEDDDFEPPAARLRDLDDAVTDSLIDEPAVVSASGRAGDCKKAAMLLLRRQGLVQRPSEKSLYDRVVHKVATNCRGEEEAIEEAIEEEQDRRDEAEEAVGMKLIRSAHDTAPGTSHEHGFRKTKQTLKRKTTGSDRAEPGVRGRGRRGAGAIEVRRGGKKTHSLRKEKAKTKRGYTWRRED